MRFPNHGTHDFDVKCVDIPGAVYRAVCKRCGTVVYDELGSLESTMRVITPPACDEVVVRKVMLS